MGVTRPDISGELDRPSHVAEFFASFAVRQGPERILDPYAVTPSIAVSVSRAVPDADVVAFSPSAAAVGLGSEVRPSVDWQLGEPWDLLPDLRQDFDLIVASPPIGLAPRLPEGKSDVLPGVSPRVWKQNAAHLALCLAERCLSHDGTIAFLLGEQSLPRFSGALMEFLEQKGLRLESSIAVRDGLAPVTRVETQIAIFGRSRSCQLFIGRIGPGVPLDPLIGNLMERRPGPEVGLGSLVDGSTYRGWLSTKAMREVQASLGADSVVATLEEIAVDIRFLKLEQGDSGPEFENAFYLPKVGTGPARLSVDWQSTGPASRTVVAVDLDQERADAAFVAQWLDSRQGKLARSSVATGVVPRIPRRDLKELLVPLPPVEHQRQLVALRRETAGLRVELEALDEAISVALSPGALSDSIRALGELREGDDVETWGNRLPFPVASILKRYLADAEIRGKYDRLLFFFEAFAAFLATTLLSAAHRDDGTWPTVRSKLQSEGGGGQPLLRQADFGSWIQIGRTLAKHFRREFGSQGADPGEAGRSLRSSSFGVADSSFYAMLVDKEIWKVLDNARVIRNRHKGHGGELSRTQLGARLEELEQLLGKLHEATSRAFDRVQLVQPGESGYDGGIYRYRKARQLIGATAVFNELEIASVLPMKSESLYFIDREDPVETAVELLPLVHLGASPETEETACFFYNAVSGGGECRFVSYHFAAEAEIPLSDAALDGLINDLAG